MTKEPELEIKSFILKPRAFQGDITLHTGIASYCTAVKGDFHHLFLDCDDYSKLRQIFDKIEILRKEFAELANEKFFIINTSTNKFSLAAFVRLTWQRCLEDIMWRSVELGLEHQGHAFYSERKDYAVLRGGGKYGIVPRIMYSLGDTVSCKKCMREFVAEFRKWNREEKKLRGSG
jgi:hypothetical protein